MIRKNKYLWLSKHFRTRKVDNIKSATIISSITFGVGHIVNLLNGAILVPTLLQISYSISLGYLFVIIFSKSKSLIPCIINHSLLNALLVFNNVNSTYIYVSSIFLIIISTIYTIYIKKVIKE